MGGRIHTQLLPEVVGVEDQEIHCDPDVCALAGTSDGMLTISAGVVVQDALTSRNHEISVNKKAGFAVSQFIGESMLENEWLYYLSCSLSQ